MARPDDVFIGIGTLYLGPLGEAFPIDPSVAVAGNWVDCGHFDQDGITFEMDRDVVVVRSAQSVDPLQAYLRSREIRLSTALVESSLENIVFASGGDDADITTDAGPPATEEWVPSDTLTFRAALLRITGGANDGKDRDVQLARVVSTGAMNIPIGPGGGALVPLQVTAFRPAAGNTIAIKDLT